MRWLTGGLAAVLGVSLAAPPALASEAGFQRVLAADPTGPPLEVGMWYPTASPASPQRLDLFVQDVARDAPVGGCCHPLVVISHGNSGSLAAHYDTAVALARAGFVVAALTHAGDNYRDHSGELRLPDRALQVRATIDYVLASWPGHATVNPDRIGMFGFSAGGFTALVLVGGKPDIGRIDPYCVTHAESFVCGLMREHGLLQARPVPDAAWVADPRIKAAVLAAPALGFVFPREALRDVVVPVQLWAAEDDSILPVADNAALVRDALPEPPEYHTVAGADHFDFLPPCPAVLALAAPVICAEQEGFDRAAFHRHFDDAVVQFFERTLGH